MAAKVYTMAQTQRPPKPHYRLQVIAMVHNPDGTVQACGRIYGRNPGEGEFADGHRVLTSSLVKITDSEIETENSIYELI